MGKRVGQIAKVPEEKQSNSNSQVRRTKRLQLMDTPVNRILFLQRTAGNQAVSRLMRSGALQAKLRIGQPGDMYEQEADRVADAVMRMPEPGVQRQTEEEEEEEEEELVQTKTIAEQATPLIQRQAEGEEEEEGVVQPRSETSTTSSGPIRYVQRVVSGIQAKLAVGPPGDKYEQEADRVADAVMRMPEPGIQLQPIEGEEEEQIQTKPITEQITPLVQRQVDEEEEDQVQTKPITEQITPLVQRQVDEEEEDQVQTKPVTEMITPLVQRQVDEEEEEEILQTKRLGSQSHEIKPDLTIHIQSMKGGGHPLPESTRSFFEPRFGHDFSQVRVHSDAQAAEMARTVNARAFTTGQDVVFGAGQYMPRTEHGKRLMAHELTHVMQQNTGKRRVTQTRRNRESSNTSETYGVYSLTKTVYGREYQIKSSVSLEMIQLSPLSDNLEIIWATGDKGAFFNRLRNIRVRVFDIDVHDFVETTLDGDDLWLAQNLQAHGREEFWPIHLQIEREMKGWEDCGGKGKVFEILRIADGREASNFNLWNSLAKVFDAGSDDLWLAQNLQAHGREEFWPIHLQVEREMKGWEDCGGKGKVFEILRTADGREASNFNLWNSLVKVFAAGSDDLWLAQNLQVYGPEASWPIHLQVEREMKGWDDCGGKGKVFDILRTANGSEAGNADLKKSIRKVFTAGSQDRWLAQVLQALGPETSWTAYLTKLWDDIKSGKIPVPTMEFIGHEVYILEADVRLIIEYILKEMLSNAASPEVRRMYELNSPNIEGCITWWQRLTRLSLLGGFAARCKNTVFAKLAAMSLFAMKVRPGGPWDHKPHIGSNWGYWRRIGEYKYYYDIWSNIHFGYVGTAAGFSESVLLDGAGAVQIVSTLARFRLPRMSKNVKGLRAFDDPSDRASIRIGIRLYKTGATFQSILIAVLRNNELSRKPVSP